ncbi:PP2C family protein-serine/threonine phosphatase [Streptomyces sp. NPDC008313]|uniref:PP2C family protein-serine/threonine phosphatase n=1 Tax=Streptomyces sp. NPDC008313 TaxID=3364826 RepID=UPI0036E6B8C2
MKGTTLRSDAHEESGDGPADAPRRDGPASLAADAIGSQLDLTLTGGHVVRALAPDFADAASVYLLERWLVEENAHVSADPPQIEARRLALRVGAHGHEDGEGALPVGQVVVFPRDTPYARALATGGSQLLDAVDSHTSDRLAATAAEDVRIGALLRSASFLIVPMRLQGTPVGFIACTRGPERPPFAPGDVAAVESLAVRSCVALDNARRYERERRTALAIRRSLLPTTGASFAGCRIAHSYLPAGEDNIIGGDWFDVLRRPGRRVGLIVGDAMGHGPESAVAMIQLRTAVRTLAGLDIGPVDLIRRLDALAADTPGASFATCMYAEWDAERHTCTLVGAGHPPPLVRGPNAPGAPVALRGAGLPLGLGSWNCEPTVLDVREPTLLLLYSDGLVETRGFDIDEGIARLAGALDAGSEKLTCRADQDSLQSLCDLLLHQVRGGDTADDRTLLLAELRPSGM